ncbi:beta-propeller domain-containing protein [Lysobacter xanthus]
MRRLHLAFALPLALAVLPALAAGDTLTPFRSEAQFARTLDAWHAQKVREMERQQRRMATMKSSMPPMPPPAPVALSAPASQELNSVQVTGSRIAAADTETITNVQTQGVDEGDIVKRQGDYLIVLRRGRLFTVRVGGDRLEPVSAVDAFAPDADPSGTWYDEMLVSDGTVAIIGYSYSRGGTEVGLFDLDARGGLKYRATYQLRSNDYYSARNYASRLVGHKLVFYTPMALNPWSPWRDRLPAYRRWAGATPASFERMLPASRIYRGLDELDDDVALHTVSVCDLDRPRMACESTAVLGGSGEVFYVAEDAVYVWTTGGRNARGTPTASIFRMPLDGGAPSMLRAWGGPVDQMGFLQKDGWLNVLVARTANGDGMWSSRQAGEDMALLRVPLSDFGDIEARAPKSRYRLLPGTSGWNLHQRFIGDWLVYGDHDGSRQQVHALRYAAPAPVQTFPLPHSLERIDAMGGDGVLVGGDGSDLVFTGLRLRGTHAALAGAYRRKDAQQGDDRTHGFFYRPTGEDEGLLGLPIVRGGDHPGASVLYLRNRALALSPLGTLDSRVGEVDDACRASCVDWYGNARPIFLGDRVFALMGYELVEGRLEAGAIHERRRANFAAPQSITVR